jgi:hypothetical protein
MQYIAGKFRKCEKLPEQGMYLSRSRTGNIFPYRTVVVLRHHVYVPEFHDPSCYSVQRFKFFSVVAYSAYNVGYSAKKLEMYRFFSAGMF